MIRKIATYPDPILLKKAKPCAKVDDEIRTLLTDMAETMYAGNGVGLAAPQISVSLRVIVVDINETDVPSSGLIKMVNPEIISREGEIEWQEGCLSVPDLCIVIKRSKHIRVRYLNEKNISKELDAEGLLAVAIQHEIDHLDGKLIIDNLSRLKRDLYLKKLKKEQCSTVL